MLVTASRLAALKCMTSKTNPAPAPRLTLEEPRPAFWPAGPNPQDAWDGFDPWDDRMVVWAYEDWAAPDGSPDEVYVPPVAPPEMLRRPERFFFLLTNCEDGEEESLPEGHPPEGFETEAEAMAAGDAWAAKQWHVCPTCEGTSPSSWSLYEDDRCCGSCGGSLYTAWGEGVWGCTLEEREDEAADRAASMMERWSER